MYIALGKVKASKENGKYPEGEKHAFLAYAKAASHDEAEQIIVKELAVAGWAFPEISKIGVIDPDQNKEDESVRNANEVGFSAVIYSGVEQ